MPCGDKFFFRGVYFYYFTFFGFSVETGDCTGENPGVKSFERLFFAGFEVYFMQLIYNFAFDSKKDLGMAAALSLIVLVALVIINSIQMRGMRDNTK